MSNPFKQYVKHFLSFNRSDRNAILILSSVIFCLVTGAVVMRNMNPVPKSDLTEIKALLNDWEKTKTNSEAEAKLTLFNFDPNFITKDDLDSLDLPEFIKRNLINYRNAGGKFKTPADFRKIYGMNDSIFTLLEEYIQITKKEEVAIKPKNKIIVKPEGTFDPNTASISDLMSFGFSNYQANNLVNYRNKGGSFRNSADIIKIYGIDSAFYLRVEEFIKVEIPEEIIQFVPEEDVMLDAMLELNSIDTLELVKLNGIGPAYAKRIIKYRDLLGGYYSKEQLKEIYNFPEETYAKIQSQVYVDTLTIAKLRINFAEFSELLRHPYLNKTQVNALLNKRDKEGPISNISDLQSLNAFDSEAIRKITPYITCR